MSNKLYKGHHGFSLLEIMVALTLVATMFVLIPMGFVQTDRQKLEEVTNEFDRAVRFAQNESILRNSIVRINILLDKDPIEYSVQFGPSGNLVLPTLEDTSKMNLQERELQSKKQSDLDGQFNRIEEFSSENKTLLEGVTILGMASSYLKSIKQDGSLSIYFYPTGEKDESLLFFSTATELATFEIPAFENEIFIDYIKYSEADLATLSDSQQNKMKELYDQWIRD